MRSKLTIEGKNIKADELVQDSAGQVFCMPYCDSGHFKVQIFDKLGSQIDSIEDINEHLGIEIEEDSRFNVTCKSINALFIH